MVLVLYTNYRIRSDFSFKFRTKESITYGVVTESKREALAQSTTNVVDSFVSARAHCNQVKQSFRFCVLTLITFKRRAHKCCGVRSTQTIPLSRQYFVRWLFFLYLTLHFWLSSYFLVLFPLLYQSRVVAHIRRHILIFNSQREYFDLLYLLQ